MGSTRESRYEDYADRTWNVKYKKHIEGRVALVYELYLL